MKASDGGGQPLAKVLHEALVLTSILAVADYGAWRHALASISELGVSPAVDPDLTPRRLQPQYRVDVAKSTWANIQQIIGSDHRSDRFQEHYAMAMETADRLSVRLDATTQFPVRVFACPDTEWALRPNEHEQNLAWMRSMTATVVALSSADDGQSDDAQMSLRLDSVALMLQNLEIRSAVFSEILVLIETGVRISYP